MKIIIELDVKDEKDLRKVNEFLLSIAKELDGDKK
jgi:hypothetical protein